MSLLSYSLQNTHWCKKNLIISDAFTIKSPAEVWKSKVCIRIGPWDSIITFQTILNPIGFATFGVNMIILTFVQWTICQWLGTSKKNNGMVKILCKDTNLLCIMGSYLTFVQYILDKIMALGKQKWVKILLAFFCKA